MVISVNLSSLTKKLADIFFVWGQHFSDLYASSGDQSKFHVISGYPGDHFIERFMNESEKIGMDEGPGSITIYDTTFYKDLFISKESVFELINTVLKFAKSAGMKVVVKSKASGSDYALLQEKFPHVLNVISGKADLKAAITADVVVGLSSSSPVMIAGVWQKNVIFYDPHEVMWAQGCKYLIDNCATTPTDVIEKLSVRLTDAVVSSDAYMIDPFADGEASARIQTFLSNSCYLPTLVNRLG